MEHPPPPTPGDELTEWQAARIRELTLEIETLEIENVKLRRELLLMIQRIIYRGPCHSRVPSTASCSTEARLFYP